MPQCYIPVIDEVIRGIERSMVGTRDAVRVLEATIRQLGDSGVDPYLLIAVLIEGATRTLDNHIPAERQADTARAVANLLADRLKVQGYGGGQEAP